MNRNQEKREREFMQKLEETYPGEYELLSPFISTKKPLTVRHSCGSVHTYTEAKNIFRGGCRVCWNRSKSVAHFSDVRSKLEGEGVMIAGDVCGKNGHVRLICNVCGHEYVKRLESADRFPKCPKCQSAARQDRQNTALAMKRSKREQRSAVVQANRERIVAEYLDKGYSFVSMDGKNVVLRHDKCGRLYHTNVYNIRRGCGCRACSRCGSSKGVQEIEDILTQCGVAFEREKTFASCVYERHLHFDFFLPEANALIEYNGEQHYRATDYFGGVEALARYQARDRYKAEWAKANGFILFVIAWRDNINDAVRGLLTQVGQQPGPSLLLRPC